MSVNSKMTTIADKIRSVLGVTGAMGLDAMASNLESVKTDINSAFITIGKKGGIVPVQKISGNLGYAIRSIPDGDSEGGSNLIATMQIAENQGIAPEVTSYINDVTMEGETV